MFGLLPGDRALVVGAHPDDETVGMAGTIAAMTGYGIQVDVLSVVCVTTPMYGGHSDSRTRLDEFHEACDVLGVDRRRVAWLDDRRAASPSTHLSELVALIETGEDVSLAASRPAALFIPAGGHHQDHQAVHLAALAAVRPGPRPGRPLPRLVLGYDGPEDRAWLAGCAPRPVLIDITSALQAKAKALACYQSQLRDDPHPRSIEKIQAQDCAAGAEIGAHAAERFAVYRMAFS
ncbi:PIG-L family deacetylase [Frankia sp. R82]|uniref:PIG-L deacetylase family protein n=1 Tax=Frankia sp. R82 TaxID=2950553 RepID=UPI0020436DDC|nr:PIG-L family deacetylase [Frankia sp. R82]MCM3883531.1 PIG-L family deacetylase [Frankia sp. R82]